MKPTHPEKNLLDYLFRGFRSTLKEYSPTNKEKKESPFASEGGRGHSSSINKNKKQSSELWAGPACWPAWG